MTNLERLTDRTQRQIDDASMDHCYVQNPNGDVHLAEGLVVHLDRGHVRTRTEALAFSLVVEAKRWRANGGVGRAVVRFQHPDGDKKRLEGFLTVWRSAGDALAAIR